MKKEEIVDLAKLLAVVILTLVVFAQWAMIAKQREACQKEIEELVSDINKCVKEKDNARRNFEECLERLTGKCGRKKKINVGAN